MAEDGGDERQPAQSLSLMVTLTVGGNDLDVSLVARTCITVPTDCEEAIQRAGERLPMLGCDPAECPALGVQVGCTISVHRAMVTSLSRIGSNDSDKSWL
jgi:hypothetical protein